MSVKRHSSWIDGVYPRIFECLNSVSFNQYLQQNMRLGFLEINEMYVYVFHYNLLKLAFICQLSKYRKLCRICYRLPVHIYQSTRCHMTEHCHLNIKFVFKTKYHARLNVVCRWYQLLEVEADTLAQWLVVPLYLTLDVRMIWKSGMAATWQHARALVWPTIGMITAVVVLPMIQMCAGAALLLNTSIPNVLEPAAMRMIMDRAFSLVKTQITS
jgi:hypothetical protein